MEQTKVQQTEINTATTQQQRKRKYGRMKNEEDHKKEYLPEHTPAKAGRHNRRTRTNTVVIALSLAFCLAVLGVAGYLVVEASRQPKIQIPQLEPEGRVQSGTLSDPAGRQAELDAIVQEGMLTFAINATPFMKRGDGEANLMIENPPGNGNRFTVTINREDTGEEIYKSGYLDPEQYIENAPLDVALPAGEYPCLANFDAYRISDSAYIGRAAAKITLYVQN